MPLYTSLGYVDPVFQGVQSASVPTSIRPHVLPNFRAENAQISNVGAQTQLTAAQTEAVGADVALRQKLFDALFGDSGLVSGIGGIFSGIGSSNDATSSLLAQLSEYGKGREATINQAFQNRANSTLGQLQAGNLAVDTVVPSVMAGIDREKQLALGELSDQVIGKKIGVQENALDRQVASISALSQLLGGFLR